jgi:hypothetical protein
MTDQANEVPGVTVIDEAHFEQFSNDQLAYKAWVGTDTAQEVLFDDEADEDSLQDAKFEVAFACTALSVLVRRLTGMGPDELTKAIRQRQLETLVLKPEIEQMPAWETKQ